MPPRINDQAFHEAAWRILASRVGAAMIPAERLPVCEWCERNVDLSVLTACAESGPLRLRPYQREALTATELPGCREVTLEWGQRLGKSTIWALSCLHRLHRGGLAGLVVYPSSDLGAKINADLLRPLIQSLPEAASDLSVRGNTKADAYSLPSLGSVVRFLGGGSQVIALTSNWAVLDECDFVNLVNVQPDAQNMSQLRAVRLRMQTFKDRMFIVCSSPSTPKGPVHENWLLGSRGVWSLRCLGCGGLFSGSQLAWRLDSGGFGGLQWEKDVNGCVIGESCRWICPVCGRTHIEDEAVAMNEQGAFVHARPDVQWHRSFRVGALANPAAWSWREIAEGQEAATDPDGRKFLCNTLLGVPYEHKAAVEADTGSLGAALEVHKADLPADLASRLAVVTAGIDQQKSELAGTRYWVWTARGWDEEGNSWLLGSGSDTSLDALAARISGSYPWGRIDLALIDQGGFQNDETDQLVSRLPSLYYYKGEDARDLRGEPWTPSRTRAKLFLCAAVYWQVRLLELMYDPPRPKGYAWHIPLSPSEEYLAQMTSVRPNSRMAKDGRGEAYQHWCSTGTRRRDFFDAEKMSLAAMDIACHYLQPQMFRHGRKPLFWAREKLLEAARRKKLTS